MQLRRLGVGGPLVSCVGFGGMPLSILGRPDEDQSVRAIHAALDAGATLLDTADVYSMDASDIGHNERLIARALREWSGDRDGIVVATKGGSTHPEVRRWAPDGRPEHLRAACERSLAALGVERIDLYQLHSVDRTVPYAESVGALAELRERGRIRWVGISNASIEHVEIARGIVPIQTVQNILNPFYRDSLRAPFLRRSVVAHCARHGIAFLAYSPAGGFLQKRIPSHPVVARIAEQRGASPHAVVLAWVRAQGDHVVPIPGSRNPEHARDAVLSWKLELTRRERRAIDRAAFPRE